MGKILLFYKYIALEYPKRLLKWQKKICADLNLRGRILIGHEGINGTVSGENDQIEHYKTILRNHPFFSDMDLKESEGPAQAFPRMYITVRNEIVHLGVDPNAVTANMGGEHLTPDQVHTLLQNKPEDLVILDARNEVEWQIGKFTGAITPKINHFRELPAYIDQNLEQFKNKQVLMYCTGGIRCERASALLKSKGVAKKVFQIEGGIHRYIEQYPDGFFRGKNYVFDSRIAVKVNDDILGHCALCSKPCDSYTNCLNALCNKHFIACKECLAQYANSCGTACQSKLQNKEVQARPMRMCTLK